MSNSLQPALLFHFFHEICQIPRESGNEQGIIDYLNAFAQARNLPCKTDTAGNVVISKSASVGMETRPTVVLQSHVDMVCEKNADTVFDFTKDPIQYYVENGWLKACGTTLGADDGIGVASELAILDDDTLEHGPLECLFTTSEETGLDGARALQPGFFTGNMLINLDSEDEGEVYIGCAGGVDTTACFSCTRESVPAGSCAVKVTIGGGTGGHSGDDINKDRSNAVQLLARFLWKAQSEGSVRVAQLAGGNKHNAIAREAYALCVIPQGDLERFTGLFQTMTSQWKQEYRLTDPDLFGQLTPADLPHDVIDSNTAFRLISSLYCCPHGVLSMSKTIPGLVETSTNLASVKMPQPDLIRIGTSQRSDLDSLRFNAAYRIESLFTLAGAQVSHLSEYPGWAPDNNSPLLKVCQKAYETLFHQPVKVKAIHAGLECGLFRGSFPHLDMVSIGPTLRGVHAPSECLDIASAQKYWDFLLEILKHV